MAWSFFFYSEEDLGHNLSNTHNRQTVFVWFKNNRILLQSHCLRLEKSFVLSFCFVAVQIRPDYSYALTLLLIFYSRGQNIFSFAGYRSK